MPVEERQIDGPRLLGFADALEARAAAETAPAPGPELHLLTFALDREEFGIPVDPGARGHPGQRHHPGAAGAAARARRGEPARPDPRRSWSCAPGWGSRPPELDARVPRGGGGGPRAGARPAGGRGVAGDEGARDRVVPAPEEVVSADVDYLTGVARWQSRLIILLDLEKALLPTE